MKRLQLFLEYYSEVKNKIDDLLDKISSEGIESLTPKELALLKSQKKGGAASKEAYQDLTQKKIIKTYESEDDHFKFHLTSYDSEDSQSGILTTYYGVMVLPDLITPEGKVIDGELKGSLIMNEEGFIIENSFEKYGYTDYDFVSELEYEYDLFIADLAIYLGWYFGKHG